MKHASPLRESECRALRRKSARILSIRSFAQITIVVANLRPPLRYSFAGRRSNHNAAVAAAAGAAGTAAASAIYGNDMFARSQLLTAVHIEDLNLDALFLTRCLRCLRCLCHCASPP